MAGRRALHAVRLLAFLYLSASISDEDVSLSATGFFWRPKLCHHAAPLKVPILKQQKRGANVVALPFDADVMLPAYFALCCDVLPSPGPKQQIGHIPARVYSRERGNVLIHRRNTANLRKCISIPTGPPTLHVNDMKNYQDKTRPIPVRISCSM